MKATLARLSLFGMVSSVLRRVVAIVVSMPLDTDAYVRSMRNTYTGGCGGRTMYSRGATNSTIPELSSGRCHRSAG